MTNGECLQVLGAGFEVAGLATVAWGITDTRRSFTPESPSLGQQLLSPFKKLVARFRRRKSVTITASAGMISWSGGHVRATVRMGSCEDLSAEERFKRIRDMLERHEDMLSHLDEQLESERGDRKTGDEQEGRLREETRQLLETRIREAAAGGLKLESWGVLLFGLGIVFGVVGNLIA
jgi:uncharacterized protein with von Willebrand factor type A (vWA) domain